MNNLTNGAYGGTLCLAKAGLAEGTNANTIKTAAPNGAGTDYCIDGVLYHLADADNIAMTALDAQADLTTCLYLAQVNAAGTVSLKKGTEVLTADLTNEEVVVQYPTADASNCAIGAIKVVTSGGTFTSGTTDLGAAAVTDTYYDLFAIPPQGLSS